MNSKNVILTIVAILLLGIIGAEGYVYVKGNMSLTKANTDSTAISSTINKKDKQAVAKLKSLLAKTDGMKFGSSDLEMTKSFYDEKTNVVEFHFIQRVFPKSVETPELIKRITNTLISTRKKGLRQTTALIQAMDPLKPTIQDVVTYPDGSKCLSYTIPYRELFFDSNNEDNNKSKSTTDIVKERGWNFLQTHYSQFANATLNKYLPPTSEVCVNLARALDYPGLSVAAYQTTYGETYVVIFTNGTPRDAIDAKTATGDMDTWRSAVRYVLER